MTKPLVLLSLLLVIIVNTRSLAACPADIGVHVVHKSCDPCEKVYERTLPRGTQIFAYDEYVIIDFASHREDHFSKMARFACKSDTFVAYDPVYGRRATYPKNARVIFWKAAIEVPVKPGRAISAKLRQDLRRGLAYHKSVVG